MYPGKILSSVLTLFIIVLNTNGQDKPSGEVQRWEQALDSYQQGDFGAAVVHLQKVINEGASTWESAAWLMLARSYFQMEMGKQAREAAAKQICKFPYGRYAPYAYFVLAQLDFQQQRFLASALDLLTTAQTTYDNELHLLARSKLERLFEIYLTEDQKNAVQERAESPFIQAELAAIRQGYRLPLKIGVVLPFSGFRGEIGLKILSGIEHAVAEIRRRQRLEVEIVSLDSRGEIVEAIRAAKSLVKDEGIVALIGDLDGPSSAAVAAIATQKGIPLVIPHSQEVGLTRIGPEIFQLMTDYQLEGEAAAQYASQSLGLHQVAILAPASDEGMQRVQGFQQAFEAEGGSIVSVQWYYQETTNFQRQLAAIAQADKVELSSDPLELEASTTNNLEHPLGSEIISDSLLSHRSINSVEALYLPVQGEEIALLAPQLAATGFNRTIISDAVCLDLLGRESVRRYLENVIFPANYSTYLGVDLESDFARTYQSRNGAWPDYWNLIGWDAFQFLAQGLKESGKTNSIKISTRLSQVRRLSAARLDMYLPEKERVNHAIYILTYRNGSIQQLESPLVIKGDQNP